MKGDNRDIPANTKSGVDEQNGKQRWKDAPTEKEIYVDHKQ